MPQFPSALPLVDTITSSQTLAEILHASRHNTDRAEIRAIAEKVGADSSAVTSSHDYKLSGITGSGKAQLQSAMLDSLSAKSFTGTGNVVLATAPSLSNPTITGGGSWAGSPTITSPTINSPTITTPTITVPVIADFSSANHSHTGTSSGGQLSSLSEAFSGCHLRRTTSKSLTTSTWTVIEFDAETYDVGGYHSTSTNTERITMPTAGYYELKGYISFTSNATGVRHIRIRKNGVDTERLANSSSPATAGAGGNRLVTVFEDYFAAGDYAELMAFQDSGGALDVNGENINVGLCRFIASRRGI